MMEIQLTIDGCILEKRYSHFLLCTLSDAYFHSAVVELGIKKITNDYNTRFNNGFPNDYYNEFGRYITELLIYKHQQIKLKTPIDEALNEVVKLIDNIRGTVSILICAFCIHNLRV